jgi:hypothetical protein
MGESFLSLILPRLAISRAPKRGFHEDRKMTVEDINNAQAVKFTSSLDRVSQGNCTSEPELCPEPKRNLDYFVWEIGKRWHRTTEGVLEVADLCVAAIKELPDGERSRLSGRLGFCKGTLSKLVKIGHAAQLREEPVRSCLPHNYTILYEIAKLTPAQLKAAMVDGVIRIDMHREDLAAWLPKDVDKDPRPETLITLAGLEVVTEGRMSLLQERLRRVLIDFPEIEGRSKNGDWTFRSFRSIDPIAEAA